VGLSTKLAAGGVVAGAALAYYVMKRHEESGESYLQILAQLPAAARQTLTGVRRRARLALEDGKAAARARENGLVRELVAAGSTGEAGPLSSPGP
jgi:hypothetical protein